MWHQSNQWEHEMLGKKFQLYNKKIIIYQSFLEMFLVLYPVSPVQYQFLWLNGSLWQNMVCFLCILCRSFIPKKDQPLFDILVGNNGEIMQARREQADDELLPDLASASDLEFSTYNSHHPAPIGRFGYVQCNCCLQPWPLRVRAMKISNFSFGAPPQIGLSTSCLRFPKNVPVISQKVAQNLLFLMKVAQSR